MPTFLGLDLAWYGTGNSSAMAVLHGDGEEVQLVNVFEALQSDDEIFSALVTSAAPDTVLAIDAPLIICNASGQRPCESEIGRRFGRADASAHTSNLARFPDARSVRLADRLVAAGWRHSPDPASDRRCSGRSLFEIYPHPAHVVLFDLARIIKYKKGNLALKRAGLSDLRRAIQTNLAFASPALVGAPVLEELLRRELTGLRGRELKMYEDALDALLCAFVAAHYWAWGSERNEMIGTMTGGYIVTPSRTVRGLPWSFANG
jgi:predicted RNase H-like nuclease